jgi:hypothetical protein
MDTQFVVIKDDFLTIKDFLMQIFLTVLKQKYQETLSRDILG